MAKRSGKCAVDECADPIYSWKLDPRGLCGFHHTSLRRFGTVEAGYKERFFELVDKTSDPGGCWLWTGGTSREDGSGYGLYHSIAFRIPGSSTHAHRISYEFERGPIPDGLDIDHKCHVLICVNPAHLRVATRKQNVENLKRAFGKVGIRGVVAHQGKFVARVGHNRRSIYVGVFDTPEQAGEAARIKRLELFTHNDLDRQAG